MRILLVAALAAASTSCFVSEGGQVPNECLQNGILVDPCVVNARAGQTVELAGSIAGAPGAPVDWILPKSAADAFDIVAEPNRLTLVSKQNVDSIFPVQASDPADSARFSGASIQVARADFSNTPPPFVLFGGDLPVGSKSSATAAGGNLYYVAYADSAAPFAATGGAGLGTGLNFYVQQFEVGTNRLLATISGQFLGFDDPQASLPIVPNVAADCDGNGYWVDVDPALGYVLRKLAPGATNYEQQALGAYSELRLDTLSVACDGTLYFVGQTAPFDGADATVYSVALMPDGRGVLAGAFATYDGVPRNGVVRVLPDGRLDPSFQPGLGADNIVYTVLRLPDGKLLIGGDFSFYDGIYRPGVARLNSDGSLDQAFNPLPSQPQVQGAFFEVNALALLPSGKILVGGYFSGSSGVPGNSIVRLNANGSFDPTFNAGTGALVKGFPSGINDLVVQPDGKILVGGYFDEFAGVARNNLARLNPNGSLDQTYMASNSGPSYEVEALALQPDGKCVIGGAFALVDGQSRNALARLNANGTLDPSFDPGAGLTYFESTGVANALALQEDGSVLVGGQFDLCGSTSRNNIARVAADGAVDPTFDPGAGPDAAVQFVLLAPDQKIVIGGDFTSYDGVLRDYAARLNQDGSLEDGPSVPVAALAGPAVAPGGTHSFGPFPGADATVGDVITQLDLSILIAGDFTQVGGFPRPGIARLLPDGTLDLAFDTSLSVPVGTSIGAMALQQDGKIVIAGAVGTQAVLRVLRLNADGTLDQSFASTAIAGSSLAGPSELAALAVHGIQGNEQIIVGGRFDSFAGQTCNGLVRLGSDGNVDPTFNAGAGGLDAQGQLGHVFDVVVQPDGNIVVGGFFATFGGQPRGSLARLLADGSVDPSFTTGTTGFDFNVYSVVLDPFSGSSIYAGGDFASYDGVPRNSVVRLDATGVLETGFDAGAGAQTLGQLPPFVYTIVPYPSLGGILVCGNFNSFDGVAAGSVALLDVNGAPAVFDSFPGADGAVFDADLASGSLIAIGGAFTSYSGFLRDRFALLFPDGTLYTGDTTPGPGGDAPLGLNRMQAFGKYPRYVLPADLETVSLLEAVDSMVIDSKGRIVVGSSGVEAVAWGARILVSTVGAEHVASIDTGFIDVFAGKFDDPDLVPGPVADVAVDAGDAVYFAIDGGLDGQYVSARNTMGAEVYRVTDYVNVCPTACSDPKAACGETVPFEKIVSIGAAGPGYLRVVDDISTATLPVECQESLRFILLDPR